jgi:hypothetical protein
VLHRVYLSPGMFGFGRLASYEYFGHLERALASRIRAAGDDVVIHVAQVAPTASIRRRAQTLAKLVAETCEQGGPASGPIHLIGHSTGGLDARLVASPTVSLALPPGGPHWQTRIASVTTINTPHFGTPLASFFTTVSGMRVLTALSALTVVALTVGAPPLSAMGALVAAFGRADRALGFDLKVLEGATGSLLKAIGEVQTKDVRDYVTAVYEDSGAMVQLMPEAMDLFIAGVEDCPGVLYQSTASMAARPAPRKVLRSVLNPWATVSGAIFTLMQGIAARYDRRYPCAAPQADDDSERVLVRALGRAPEPSENDGVVPVRSQLWGRLVWAGYGDHLDVLGHFDGGRPRPDQPAHVDWMHSGSGFDAARFDSLVDAIASGLLSAPLPG